MVKYIVCKKDTWCCSKNVKYKITKTVLSRTNTLQYIFICDDGEERLTELVPGILELQKEYISKLDEEIDNIQTLGYRNG